MFDQTNNGNNTLENSDFVKKEKRGNMNSSKTNIFNSPALLKGMSHEMRTHMNAIVAFSFILKEGCSNNPESEDLSSQILSSCEQLIELFDSFLDSAIIDTGNSNSYSKICKLDNLLDDLLSEFRETLGKTGAKDLTLISEIEPSDSIEVYIDTNRVMRVIRSLFHNAVNNTKSGLIKLGYSFIDEKLTFHIIDTGQGFFKCKEFLQTENLNESLALFNDASAAIDITLARKIIQLSGGSIWLECNGISGSAIYFTVPARVTKSSNIDNTLYTKSMIAI